LIVYSNCSNTVRSELTTMIRNIIVILTFIVFTSCKYDYIHDNPKHPQEYLGNWNCDSTLPKAAEKRNFSIMQTGVDITLNAHTIASYPDWEVDEQRITFTLLNDKYVPILSYEIVQKPYKLALRDTSNKITYYLHH
jgi:hypothetical protein